MLLKSLFSAFLMYSRIPMPKVEWKEENRRYVFCFFPLIGAVIGGLFLLWGLLCKRLGFSTFLYGAVSSLIPIIVTGGIHIDGFCDVTDAKSSYGDREKRLEIMKDSHIGAFAVINLCIYMIVQTALFSQINDFKTAVVVALGFVLSRSMSGFSAVTFKSAKSEGSLQSFVKPAHKKITVSVTALSALLCFCGMIVTDRFSGIAVTVTALCVMFYYRKFSYKTFGGITGDLCGWFLQLCEIWVLASAVISDSLEVFIK